MASALLVLAACAADGGANDADAGADEALEPAPPLCLIELHCAADIPDEPKTDCTVQIAADQDRVMEVYTGGAALERRGRTSQGYDKPSYSLELRTATGEENPTRLLGMGRESDWILDGLWVDRSLVRNELVFALFRSLPPARWAPRGRFCELTLNDEPRGIYRLGERIKRDDDRIDIPEDDGSGQSFVVKQDSDGALHWEIGEESRWKLVSPNQERASDAQQQGVQAFLDELDAALHDPSADLFALLDLDAVVDFVIMQELAKSVDAYNLSLHLWKRPGAPAQLVPWDFDLSMGQPYSTVRPGTELTSGWVLHRTLLSDGLDQRQAFRSRLAERWRMHRSGPLTEQAIMAVIDRALVTLEPAVVAENFELWPLADVSFDDIYPPYTFYAVASHREEIDRQKAWLVARLAWIDTHIDAYPD